MTFLEICNALRDAGIESYSYEAKILCEEICGEFNEEKDYNSEALVAATEKRAATIVRHLHRSVAYRARKYFLKVFILKS